MIICCYAQSRREMTIADLDLRRRIILLWPRRLGWSKHERRGVVPFRRLPIRNRNDFCMTYIFPDEEYCLRK
jgi:hypothetical protein